jgi:hypothetical protein
LSKAGALKDPESAGPYLGFLAGVLNANPRRAARLVAQIQPLPFQDQWLLIRAIAYSGLPEWKALLKSAGAKMKERQTLIDYYLDGRLLPIDAIPVSEKPPGFWQRLRFKKHDGDDEPETFVDHPELLDTLWGMYFAAGSDVPIRRIITLLPLSRDRNDVGRLTLGSMARFTLATNASRDVKLLQILKRAAPQQPKDTAPVLEEVILAAETTDTVKLRKEALAAIETLKTKGPASRRNQVWWTRVGEGAISAGCVVAAVTGAVGLGLPCIVGGSLASGAVHYLSTP